jgi:hypothetical protein
MNPDGSFIKRMFKDYTYLILALVVAIIAILIMRGFSNYGHSEKQSERSNNIQDALEKTEPENRGFGN